MSKTKAHPRSEAFPMPADMPRRGPIRGMSLRAYIATDVFSTLAMRHEDGTPYSFSAEQAVEMADALIEALNE